MAAITLLEVTVLDLKEALIAQTASGALFFLYPRVEFENQLGFRVTAQLVFLQYPTTSFWFDNYCPCNDQKVVKCLAYISCPSDIFACARGARGLVQTTFSLVERQNGGGAAGFDLTHLESWNIKTYLSSCRTHVNFRPKPSFQPLAFPWSIFHRPQKVSLFAPLAHLSGHQCFSFG